jgi:hypothetical protein
MRCAANVLRCSLAAEFIRVPPCLRSAFRRRATGSCAFSTASRSTAASWPTG